MTRPRTIWLLGLVLLLAPFAYALQLGAGQDFLAGWLQLQRDAHRAMTVHLRTLREAPSGAGLAVATALAFAYGVLHALGPGHGKAVITGYFLGRDARVGRGLVMGCQIAALHVVSALVVVLLADLLLRRGFGGAPAEVPAIRALSYGSIAVLGLWLTWRATRRLRAVSRPGHGGHGHDDGCAHAHAGEGGLMALAVGLVPCSGAVLILLYTLANDMLAVGVLLAVAIAVGMAVTMGALGLASVWARRLVLAGSAARPRLSARLELGSALLVTTLGIFLLATAV